MISRVSSGNSPQVRRLHCAKPTVHASSRRSSGIGHLTQVELAGSTGLSPATVSNIVKELAASGIINRSVTSRSGRRATEVTLARQLGLVAALHFASRHLRVAISDIALGIVVENHVPLALDHRLDREFDRAALLLATCSSRLTPRSRTCSRWEWRSPCRSTRATGWLPRRASCAAGRTFQSPSPCAADGGTVFVDHEANLGALAEYRFGAARGAQVAAYIQVGHRISAGLVIDGTIFRGVTGKAGQIGHVTIDDTARFALRKPRVP